MSNYEKYYGKAFAHNLQEIGGIIPPQAGFAYNPYAFFTEAPIAEVLDGITILWRTLHPSAGLVLLDDLAAKWMNFVRQVLEEESIGYRLDARCGVHYSVDAEYERTRSSTISGLASSRYSAVKTAFEEAFSKLDSHPADTKGAVRDAFEAVEILSKLIAVTNQDLDAKLVKNTLKSIAQNSFQVGHGSQQAFIDNIIEGLADWVNAGHKYRHGQQTEEPVTPSLSMAVAYLSMGATYIRLLVELDGLANRGGRT